MRILKWTNVLVFAGLIVATPALADENLDAIEKEIIAKWKEVKTLTAKMTMTMNMDQAGMKMQQTMKSEVAYMHKEGKWMSRMDGESETVTDMGGNKSSTMSKMTTISDGEFMHSLVEQMGQKMCMKTKADAMSQVGEQMFKQLHEQFNLTAGEDTTVEGDKCWVMLAAPKNPQPGMPAKNVFHYRQKDGMTVLMVGYDASDKEMMRMTYSDIKVNEKLDPEMFVFKAPEGVQVMDMTGAP